MGQFFSKQSEPDSHCQPNLIFSEQLQESEIRDIEGWIGSSKEIRLMVSGKTGVGKSTLLNGIIGQTIFVEGDDYKPTTLEVKTRRATKGNIDIVVFDTPGLQDGSGNEHVYLASMKEKCKDIHLLLYCISMAEVRSDLSTHNTAIKQITEALEPGIWENAVIVLTFANICENRLLDQDKTEGQVNSIFEGKVKEWKREVKISLHNLGVSNEIADNIPVIPAGFKTKPHLISQTYWLSNFWTESVLSMKEEAQAAMVKTSLDGFKNEEDIKPEDFDKKIEDQPIVFKMVDKAIGGGAATAGAVGGATTGALIGALAIGIPSFGVAAGVGLLLGAIIGGSIGTGGGFGAGLLVALYRRNKKKRKMRIIKKEALKQLGRDLASP